MNFLNIFFSTLFILILLLGCQKNSHEPNIENTIWDLTERFPQLPKGTGTQSEFYKLTRTVIIGEKNIELQLRSSPDSIHDSQQLIIVINQKNECYAIPFFSNKYRDYWNFKFDTIVPTVKKTNTTFEKEFNTAMQVLGLKDSLSTGNQVFYELLVSLIHCEIVRETDSLYFGSGVYDTSYDCCDLPEEEHDSCEARTRRNFEEIKRGMKCGEYCTVHKAYYDRSNQRIYEHTDFPPKQGLFNLRLKLYRQDCVWHPINM